MQFKAGAVDNLARMICGDNPVPFPYRSSSLLTEFFRNLDLDFVHKGESRNPWARDAITQLNRQSPVDGPLPSPELVRVIDSLMDPDYFERYPYGNVNYDEAVEYMNRTLRQYRLEVHKDPTTAVAKLRHIDGEFVSTAKTEVEAVRRITFSPSVFQVPAEGVQEDLVSVMMPFDGKFKPVYEAIQQACKENGLRCKRADDIWANSTIIQDIFDLIFLSSIVVVDFTGKNPNVMYETGIAHTLGKHVVPMSQAMADVPFDLQQHRVLTYLGNTEGVAKMKAELSRRLATLVEGHSWSDF